jgi:endo-1,4-beta-xylanase
MALIAKKYRPRERPGETPARAGLGEAYPPPRSLRQEADRLDKLVGAAVDPSHFTESSYVATLAREFNMVEPENVMKWAAIRPSQGQFDFGPADQVVAFAEAHGMKVRGHNLLWGEFNPDWLTQPGAFTPDELFRLLRDHIWRVMDHYAGQVFAWDVVNEAFDEHGKLQDSIWYNQPGIGLAGGGTAYIEQAFCWARETDPDALLFYNDWGAEGINPKSNAVFEMVKDFKSRGVPIDGVGLQTHLDFRTGDLHELSTNIKRLAKLGVTVHVTEMDVALPLDRHGDPADPADLSIQASLYGEVAAACARLPGCTAFQTWGVTDLYTWLLDYTHGEEGAPLLFDRKYARKAAYQAVLDAFHKAPSRASDPTPAPAGAGGS